MNETTWRIYGIRHAINANRTRGQNYILDPDPGAPLVLDFYCWVLVSDDRAIMVDTGMDPQVAARHGHTPLLSPVAALAALGLEAAQIDTVLLTHAHYDHLGYLDAFPNAQFCMQAEEMVYITGPFMARPWFRRAYETAEILKLVSLLHAGRLHLHGRERQVADGVSLHWVGGHTAGQEIVRVRTARGWVVLASDALHYYEEYERGIPFAIVYSSADMIAGHDVIRALADSDDHVLPGHDPRLALIYPQAESAGSEHVLRLDAEPAARG